MNLFTDKTVSKFIYEKMFNISLSKSFYENYLINTNLKYLSNWNEAKSIKGFKIELIGRVLLGHSIDLTEIARDHPSVTTISKNYIGLNHDF